MTSNMATNSSIGFLLAKYLNIFSSKTTDLFEMETLLESSVNVPLQSACKSKRWLALQDKFDIRPHGKKEFLEL